MGLEPVRMANKEARPKLFCIIK